MRILVVGSSRSSVRPKELPGLVAKKRSVIATVAITLALSVCGTALADTVAPIPDRVYSDGAARQSGPVAERAYSDAPAAATSVRGDAAPAAPAAAVTPAAASSDGLSAFIIVLISIGGALMLSAAAYVTVRLVHHHGHAAT